VTTKGSIGNRESIHATLALNRNGVFDLEYDLTVIEIWGDTLMTFAVLAEIPLVLRR